VDLGNRYKISKFLNENSIEEAAPKYFEQQVPELDFA
jgi:hypothetical protein